MTTKHFFEPDYAVAPGATLKEALEERNISQADFSVRTGLTEKTISQIINGVAPISYETAERFELVLGIPAAYWNNRESQYQAALLRTAELKRLESEREWLAEIPVKVLVERGYIPKCDGVSATVREVLKFFQVSSVETWNAYWKEPQVQFRGGRSAQNKRPGYVAAWLRMGEIGAAKIDCEPFDEAKFRFALTEIRKLITSDPDHWMPRMVSLCAAAGVAVVWTKEIPNAGVCGITKWLSKDKALIVLSLKYKFIDQVWFSFFHEACHVLKHGKKIVFYEFGRHDHDEMEKEADAFAADTLIPRNEAAKLPFLKTQATITEFATSIGVPPGVVVGRLQHDKLLSHSQFINLRGKYKWKEV